MYLWEAVVAGWRTRWDFEALAPFPNSQVEAEYKQRVYERIKKAFRKRAGQPLVSTSIFVTVAEALGCLSLQGFSRDSLVFYCCLVVCRLLLAAVYRHMAANVRDPTLIPMLLVGYSAAHSLSDAVIVRLTFSALNPWLRIGFSAFSFASALQFQSALTIPWGTSLVKVSLSFLCSHVARFLVLASHSGWEGDLHYLFVAQGLFLLLLMADTSRTALVLETLRRNSFAYTPLELSPRPPCSPAPAPGVVKVLEDPGSPAVNGGAGGVGSPAGSLLSPVSSCSNASGRPRRLFRIDEGVGGERPPNKDALPLPGMVRRGSAALGMRGMGGVGMQSGGTRSTHPLLDQIGKLRQRYRFNDELRRFLDATAETLEGLQEGSMRADSAAQELFGLSIALSGEEDEEEMEAAEGASAVSDSGGVGGSSGGEYEELEKYLTAISGRRRLRSRRKTLMNLLAPRGDEPGALSSVSQRSARGKRQTTMELSALSLPLQIPTPSPESAGDDGGRRRIFLQGRGEKEGEEGEEGRGTPSSCLSRRSEQSEKSRGALSEGEGEGERSVERRERTGSERAGDEDRIGRGSICVSDLGEAGSMGEDSERGDRKVVKSRRRQSTAPVVGAPSASTEAVGRLDLDLHLAAETTGGRPLTAVAVAIGSRHPFLSDLSLNKGAFFRFASAVEDCYLDVPFHNSLHGAEVLNAMIFLLDISGGAKWLPRTEYLACLIACAAHDVGHPGTNNLFEVNSRSDLALTYNDRSVLENFHACVCWSILREEGSDVLEGLPDSTWRSIRLLVCDLILETDMKKHFPASAAFKAALAGWGSLEGKGGGGGRGWGTKEGDWTVGEDGAEKNLMLRMFMKAADVCHAAKPFAIHERYSRAIYEEFHAQGDLEKELGLPVSPLCNREGFDFEKEQEGFTKVIVIPMLILLSSALQNEDFDRRMLAPAEKNLRRWTNLRRDLSASASRLQFQSQGQSRSRHSISSVKGDGDRESVAGGAPTHTSAARRQSAVSEAASLKPPPRVSSGYSISSNHSPKSMEGSPARRQGPPVALPPAPLTAARRRSSRMMSGADSRGTGASVQTGGTVHPWNVVAENSSLVGEIESVASPKSPTSGPVMTPPTMSPFGGRRSAPHRTVHPFLSDDAVKNSSSSQQQRKIFASLKNLLNTADRLPSHTDLGTLCEERGREGGREREVTGGDSSVTSGASPPPAAAGEEQGGFPSPAWGGSESGHRSPGVGRVRTCPERIQEDREKGGGEKDDGLDPGGEG
uniref:Phosphodiesterase n=1 Tax=Chromera velia CCMP2878 TaxID=1169474 RepID=A0A0G4HUW5_9ALVE|eukprot:Cvel_8705.t1-p1 / transcript=Cvel_8705.t1 / gene=Cvel_8705 / organism=Chromera_velia_CCMP2878 / gene_product=Calcium/calmodulin-dependent 3',5'-cyclic, putative / transcript_product=Calcium/calmodulin-dependent 3',5'-cyclic, putative / location=Cvel_scaffold486:11184-22826(+) / protein_length=1258 / sequence_SO=supercontig / SO=protein_coding / is_pseudo=false